jgi:hypothetical protein
MSDPVFDAPNVIGANVSAPVDVDIGREPSDVTAGKPLQHRILLQSRCILSGDFLGIELTANRIASRPAAAWSRLRIPTPRPSIATQAKTSPRRKLWVRRV